MITFDYGFRTEYKHIYFTIQFLPVVDLFIRHKYISLVEDYNERYRLLSEYHS